ncbi:MAG: hypothetical protein NTU49_05560 [Gammaproteobacteria bacterium]|nr:hypothetical protein [Gammaproteobacteria bacterium]
MRLILTLGILLFSFASAAFANIQPINNFHEGLRYWGGGGKACAKAMKNVHIYETIFSNFNPGGGGTIYISLQNPDSSRPPINTYLFKDGDEDRYGFTNYYNPHILLRVNHRNVGLYAIILNLCMNGQKQSAIMVYLNPAKSCLLTTHAWNYCPRVENI